MGCQEATGPWFVTKYPCSVYTYNCNEQGTLTPNEMSLSHLHGSSLVFLAFSHCPELQVPQTQRFQNLLGFLAHNSTIFEWTSQNSISATEHTKLTSVLITRTNTTRIPDGMLEPLPTSLDNIELTYTNLTTLPADLHEKWHSLTLMYLENSLLTEFPETLVHLDIAELSLHGNLIKTLPQLAETHRNFYSLAMNKNPLRELPETLGDSAGFVYFSAESTQLAKLPEWAHTHIGAAMYLHGTPYCDRQQGDVINRPLIACVSRDNRADGKCPIDLVDLYLPLQEDKPHA